MRRYTEKELDDDLLARVQHEGRPLTKYIKGVCDGWMLALGMDMEDKMATSK